ncbi:hypothetical protein M569_17472 [Genlisea aurea]|uniref:Uncharacterized protein n=1 Tax=Genlisea aurea TaxID=192259 RepID=S8BYZ3_9LAMI|nr:hypothetical protein M569_17472 [Genlisea aurea]
MAATSARKFIFRVILAATAILIFFHVGRPLFWKLSASVNKHMLSGGISELFQAVQRSVFGRMASRKRSFS